MQSVGQVVRMRVDRLGLKCMQCVCNVALLLATRHGPHPVAMGIQTCMHSVAECGSLCSDVGMVTASIRPIPCMCKLHSAADHAPLSPPAVGINAIRHT